MSSQASKQPKDLVFLGAKRTPFGSLGGTLKKIHPVELGLSAAHAALKQSGLDAADLDHSIWGNVLGVTGDSIYLPRHIGLKLGMPQSAAALGVQRLCGSGFQVAVSAQQMFQSEDSEVALIGGVENMSLSPYVLRQARFGSKLGHQPISDSMTEALHDTGAGLPMALTAENLAVRDQISREECDAFALQSQERAAQAWNSGVFSDEVVACHGLERDEHVRPESTLQGLARLKAVFKPEGVVTAGNASGIVDGAAALVVSTQQFAEARGLDPMGRLVAYAVVGCDPQVMGIGPVPAIQKVLQKTGMKLDAIDVIEINEAFAAQTLAVTQALGLDPKRINLSGGAISIGHPLAASGTRILARLLYALKKRGGGLGLGSACIGGGQGIAVILRV